MSDTLKKANWVRPTVDALQFSHSVEVEAGDSLVRVPTLWHYRDIFWRWDNGRYYDLTRDALKRVIVKECLARDIDPSTSNLDTMMNAMRAVFHIEGPTSMPFWIDPASIAEKTPSWRPGGSLDFLATRGGLISPVATALGQPFHNQPCTPLWFSTAYLPYFYDESATCEVFEEWLADTLEHDETSVAAVQEFAGSLLLPDNRYHKLLVLCGEGLTGKSTLTKVLQGLVGHQNVTSLKLSDFSGRFCLSATEGKMLVVASEAGGKVGKAAEETIKAFVSGDIVPVERKFMPPTSMVPTAKLVIVFNEAPAFVDQTDGLYRRFLFVPMTKVIKEVDVTLEGRLLREVPGILNWALKGLGRLVKRGGFIEPKRGATVGASIRLTNQSKHEFVRDRLERDGGAWTPTTELFEAYERWCASQDVPMDETPRTLTAHLIALWGVAREKRRTSLGYVWGLAGVKVLPEKPPEDLGPEDPGPPVVESNDVEPV